MPKREDINTVLVIGSGPIIIGQACEFDYSGTQACKALRGLGYKIVLVNSNPATIMTDPETADVTYIEPLNVERLTQIIEKERPDALLPNLGGQSALNLCSELSNAGVLDKYDVQVLGVKVDAIERGEDRLEFKKAMNELGIEMARSEIANTVDEALAIADKLGYPVVVRPAYTMGGAGGGLVYNVDELKTVVNRGLQASLVHQCLIEESILGWEELELEVVRDAKNNMITICFIENIDPLGVHTGDSFCSAPMLTISKEVQDRLQEQAYRIVESIGVIGGTNVQFAHDPVTDRIVVIEINPRTSRSSALASKATGFPIALVSAMLAAGLTLDEIPCGKYGTLDKYYPDGDYVVIKFARWAFEKFKGAEDKLGTQMKAVGEVMSIGKTYKEAFQKAIRSLETGRYGLGYAKNFNDLSKDELLKLLINPTSERQFIMYEALRKGATVNELFELTKIKHYFIEQMKELVEEEEKIASYKGNQLPDDVLKQAKKDGFADKYISKLLDVEEKEIRNQRLAMGMHQVWEPVHVSSTKDSSYYYSTYNGKDQDEVSNNKKIMILGGGPNRIGQGIEFDYCCVHASLALKKLGFETIIVNCNPETVSTDYNTADRLYFEPLILEDVLNIIEKENPEGVILQFGGQTAIKLANALAERGIKILGTSAEKIDEAEDREKFEEMMEELDIKRPKGRAVWDINHGIEIANEIKYPVLVRPSYVLGGQGMEICHDEYNLVKYLESSFDRDPENPVLIDKYLNGIELEVDAICDGEDVLIPGIMEHLERAGVHSGDSITVYPQQNLYKGTEEKVLEITAKISKALGTKGMMNIQFIAYENELYVIEVNPRSSRTVPYISKISGLPVIEIATRIILGETLHEIGYGTGIYKKPNVVAVKVPVFSTEKLSNVEVSLGPEMRSTGEVLGIGNTVDEAIYKGLLAAKRVNKVSGRKVLLTIRDKDKEEFLPVAKELIELGCELFATAGTQKYLEEHGVKAEIVRRVGEEEPNILTMLMNRKVDLLINTPTKANDAQRDGFKMRRTAIEYGVEVLTSIDTLNAIIRMEKKHLKAGELEIFDISKL